MTSAPATILTLNIGAASAVRAARILAWLAARRDDLVVLTETSPGAGTTLLTRGLQDLGYLTRAQPWGEQRDRGVLVASRLPPIAAPAEPLEVTLPWRLATVAVDVGVPVSVIGVYVPSRDRSAVKIDRKRAFIRSLLDALAALPASERGRALLIGDYNTVARSHVPPLPGLLGFEYEMHVELSALGFAVAHELADMQPQAPAPRPARHSSWRAQPRSASPSCWPRRSSERAGRRRRPTSPPPASAAA